MHRLLIALLALMVAVTPAGAAGVPRFDRVIMVVLENTAAERAMRETFLAQLATRGAVLTELQATTHPSQPNYIALFAGDTLGVTSNDNVTLDARHFADQLEDAGRSWKLYAQGFAGDCSLLATRGAYARKHVPFLSFRNITGNPARCARIVPDNVFDADLAAGTLPDFSLYIPDNRANGHDTGVAVASHWLERRFGPLLKNDAVMARTLLIVTFDEGSKEDNRVYTAFVGRDVKAGVTSARPYTHYNLLRTLQAGFGLGTLGRGDARAAPITEVFGQP